MLIPIKCVVGIIKLSIFPLIKDFPSVEFNDGLVNLSDKLLLSYLIKLLSL